MLDIYLLDAMCTCKRWNGGLANGEYGGKWRQTQAAMKEYEHEAGCFHCFAVSMSPVVNGAELAATARRIQHLVWSAGRSRTNLCMAIVLVAGWFD